MPVEIQRRSSGDGFFWVFLSKPKGTCQGPESSANVGCHHQPPFGVSLGKALVLELGLGQPMLSFVLVPKLSARKQHPTAGHSFVSTAAVPGVGLPCLTSEKRKTKVLQNGVLTRSTGRYLMRRNATFQKKKNIERTDFFHYPGWLLL